MHVALQLLQPLLVLDAEMLLLVDDEQAEILERDRCAEQRVGAHHDVDGAVGDALLGLGKLLRPDQPRGLLHPDREAGEALREGLEMLAREQRRRHHDGDLQSFHRGDESGAQRDLGLAEADIAADQPVHRLAGPEVVHDRVDGVLLVVGLLIGEARGELAVQALGRRQHGRRAHLALRGDADQLPRHLQQAALQPALRDCQAPPPSLSSTASASSEP